MAAFVDEAAAALGGLDLLVNNVGVFRRVSLDEMSEEVLDEAFDVNVKAAVMASRAAAPHMRRARGRGDRQRGEPRRAAPVALTPRLLRVEGGAGHGDPLPRRSRWPREIRVNAVAPGVLDPPGAEDAVRRRIPAGRFGTHAEAVEAVLFLLAGGGYTTGEVLRVDGGRALV